MTDFECIDKALSIVYMQDDLLAMLSLTQILGEEGVSIYTAAEDGLMKLLAALKKLDPITVGEGLSKISLIDLIAQIEKKSTRVHALPLLQKYHHDLVTNINLQTSVKKKDGTIHAVPVLLYSYGLIQSIYGAVPMAKLLTAIHELTKREDGYTYALEQMKNAPNAPYYLYGLLMPSIIVNDNKSNEKVFLEKLDEQYRQSGRHKKIDKKLRQKKFEADYYYEMLYYVFDYFSKFENYREAYNQGSICVVRRLQIILVAPLDFYKGNFLAVSKLMPFLVSLHYEQTQKMPDTLVAFPEKSLDVVSTMI